MWNYQLTYNRVREWRQATQPTALCFLIFDVLTFEAPTQTSSAFLSRLLRKYVHRCRLRSILCAVFINQQLSQAITAQA